MKSLLILLRTIEPMGKNTVTAWVHQKAIPAKTPYNDWKMLKKSWNVKNVKVSEYEQKGYWKEKKLNWKAKLEALKKQIAEKKEKKP